MQSPWSLTVSSIQENSSVNDSLSKTTSGWSTASDGLTTLYYQSTDTYFDCLAEIESYTSLSPGGSSYFDYVNDVSGDGSSTLQGNSSAGFTRSGGGTLVSCYTMSGEDLYVGAGGGAVTGLPESGTDGGMLDELITEQDATEELVPYYTSGSLYLYDSSVGTDYPYEVPTSAPAFLSGSTTGLADAPLAALITGSGSNSAFGFIPSTNGMTAHGLPAEKATALHNLAQNAGPDDGVSHTSTVLPTSVLVTLAAGGRNPTDITIPTQAGTEGSSGEEEEDAAADGGTFAAMDEPATGGHEVSSESPVSEGAKAFGASLFSNTFGAVYRFTTGETQAALGERAFRKAQARNIQDPGVATFLGMVGEDLIGAGAVEAWHDVDLETFEPIGGGLFDGGERSQRLAGGVAAFTGSACSGRGSSARSRRSVR